MSMNTEAFMNGTAFTKALNAKIGQGNLISHRAKKAVEGAILRLKTELISCSKKLTLAEDNCNQTQITAKEAAETAAKAGAEAAERIKQIEQDARTKGIKLNESLDKLGLSESKQFGLEERIKELESAKDGLNIQLKNELEKVKARERALYMAKEANEAAMSDVFKGALSAITTALDTINVDDMLKQTPQTGGFQSSSSGVTDFKKYRTSSRSYNIKELRKKKKESRKKEKERKKGSRKKERRSKKRRKY